MASPKLKKAIFFLYGDFVGIHGMLVTRKGRDEHYKRLFGEMKNWLRDRPCI